MTPSPSTIAAQTKILLADVEKLQAEHEQIALKLVANPEDPDLLDAEEKSSFAISATKRRIGLFNAALSGAKTKEARDAAAAKLATAFAARDEAVDLVARRVAVAKKIDAALADFQKVIAEYSRLNEQAACAAKIVVKNAATEQASLDDITCVARAARTSIGDAIVTALIHSDIEKVAPGAAKLSGRAGSATVEDVAKLAGDRLAALLDATLRRY